MIDWDDKAGLMTEQLKLQVQMQFADHFAFLVSNGLASCNNILEIGVGDGSFLTELALANQEIPFFGIDNNKSMVEKASTKAPPNMYCIYKDVLDLSSFLNIDSVDAVLMRYVLLHMQDKQAVLHEMHNVVKPGTRLWIIDVDLEQFYCQPESPEFDWIVRQVEAFCKSHGDGSNYGSILIKMLQNAGFKSIRKEVESLNNKHIAVDQFAKFILNEIIIYREALSDPMDEADYKRARLFLEELKDSARLVNYGVSLISAIA